MVKTKKGKKEIISSDEMDSDVKVIATTNVQENDEDIDTKSKKNKKKDRKKASSSKSKNINSDDDDDDEEKKQPVEKITKAVKNLSVGTSLSAGKKQKGKKVTVSSDEEDTIESPVKKAKKKSGFELLMAGGSDENSDNDGDVDRHVSSPVSDDDDFKETKNAKKGKDNDKGKAGKKGEKS